MKENPEEEIIKATQKNFHFLLGIAQQKKKHTHTEKNYSKYFLFHFSEAWNHAKTSSKPNHWHYERLHITLMLYTPEKNHSKIVVTKGFYEIFRKYTIKRQTTNS